MRTIQALIVMAIWTVAIFAIINFVGFDDHTREPLWALGGAALFIIMLIGNFWIFFAVAKEEPWEWDKSKGVNNVINVTYDAKICSHAGECVKGSPAVFKAEDGQVVINTNAAPEAEVRETVSKCPSGALQIQG